MTEDRTPYVGENDPPAPTMLERIAKAMKEAEFGYSMELTRLVDDVSTYRLTYSDGEVLEFGSAAECHLHIEAKQRVTQARAAVEAMREGDDSIHHSMGASLDYPSVYMGGPSDHNRRKAKRAWESAIDAILSEKS